MKRLLIVVCLLGLAWCLLADRSSAASGKNESILSRSNISKSLRSLRTGTRKVVRDTIDVVTLKKFRKKKSTSLPEPPKPWLNEPKKKKKEKKSIWSALLPSKKKEKSKGVKTMKEFVGLERPS